MRPTAGGAAAHRGSLLERGQVGRNSFGPEIRTRASIIAGASSTGTAGGGATSSSRLARAASDARRRELEPPPRMHRSIAKPSSRQSSVEVQPSQLRQDDGVQQVRVGGVESTLLRMRKLILITPLVSIPWLVVAWLAASGASPTLGCGLGWRMASAQEEEPAPAAEEKTPTVVVVEPVVTTTTVAVEKETKPKQKSGGGQSATARATTPTAAAAAGKQPQDGGRSSSRPTPGNHHHHHQQQRAGAAATTTTTTTAVGENAKATPFLSCTHPKSSSLLSISLTSLSVKVHTHFTPANPPEFFLFFYLRVVREHTFFK